MPGVLLPLPQLQHLSPKLMPGVLHRLRPPILSLLHQFKLTLGVVPPHRGRRLNLPLPFKILGAPLLKPRLLSLQCNRLQLQQPRLPGEPRLLHHLL